MDSSSMTQQTPRKHRFPRTALVFYGIALLSAILYIIFLFSEGFADWFNQTVGAAIRAILAHLTSWIPFSFAEYLLLMIPVIFAALVVVGLRRYADTWRSVLIYCASILSVAALIFSVFAMGFAPAYRGTTLDRKLGIQRREVSAQELYETAVILAGELNRESEQIRYSDSTRFSVMPYGYGEMNDLLLDAYDTACDKYPFVQRLRSRVKPVMLSDAMSYTHITGVYSFFTGEANLNVAFPDYTLPYTAAHELAHQRGVAREDEANFMAFLVCLESEDAYIRYSGYLNLYEYVLSALYSASPELYVRARLAAGGEIQGELVAYSDFFEKYEQSVASEVSGAVNNTFLTLHGTEGTKSYGMVVDLAVAYYLPLS
ncbi:MAG: DUF3810 domain-containing protein [Clostridia bacterium]|nr:DUF3810 domain-containing protein [Clostridia bacterium]